MTFDTIDLHTHSIYSDGTQTPEEILIEAQNIGLKALALTDHDTVAGIPGFQEAAAKHPGILAISGVEITTIYSNREIHILGLFIDHSCPVFLDFLSDIQQKRRQRNEAMARKLTYLGYDVDIEKIRTLCRGQIIGRPHFADYLIKNYEFENTHDVFEKLLKRNSPAFVPRSLPSPVKAIEAIHDAGGIAVWAHPIYRKSKESSWCRKVLKELVPVGLDAIEAYYSTFNEQQTKTVKRLADEFGIALSGGSDSHGDHHPDISLGKGYGELAVPADILAGLLEKAGIEDKIQQTD